MYTEVKELLCFFARYLRFRCPFGMMACFLELLGAELIIDFDSDATYEWNYHDQTSQVFLKAAKATGIDVDFLLSLMPKDLIIKLSPGNTTVVADGRKLDIWVGDCNADGSYSPTPLCTKILAEAPLVTSGRENQVLLPGCCIRNLAANKKQVVPSYLADNLMSKNPLLFNLVERNLNVVNFLPPDFHAKIFRITMNDQPFESDYLTAKELDSKRFGSERTANIPDVMHLDHIMQFDDSITTNDDDSRSRRHDSMSSSAMSSDESESSYGSCSRLLKTDMQDKGRYVKFSYRLLASFLTTKQKDMLMKENVIIP